MRTAAATVLTVEDDPIVRADLRLILEDAGFAICADARDGLEAVELAREHKPDVILIDLGLPRLDGAEATRRILAERDVAIVAVTGLTGRLAERALDAGVTSFLAKPFTDKGVVQAVVEALAARGARDESRRVLAEMLAHLGQPGDWAGELERSAFARGKLWRRTR
jgi:response regulator NasT